MASLPKGANIVTPPAPKFLPPGATVVGGYQPVNYSDMSIQEQYGPIEGPSFAAEVGRGYMDVQQGTQQLFRGDEYDQKVHQELALYESINDNEGFSLGRTLGQAAPFLVGGIASAAVKVPAVIAQLPGWVKLAVVGGTEGAMLATAEGESGLFNAAAGATGGVLGGELIKRAPQWGKSLLNKLFPGMKKPAVDKAVKESLKESGLNWADLTQAVRATLAEDVQRLVEGGVELEKASMEVARKQALEAQGMQPTRGTVSRDRGVFSDEANLARTDAGKPIAAIRDANQEVAKQNAEAIGRQMTPERDITKFSAGEDVKESVSMVADNYKKVETIHYNKARNALGNDIPVGVDKLNEVLNEELMVMNPDEISGPIVKRFQQYIDGELDLTVDTAEAEIRHLNKIINSSTMDPSRKRAATSLKHAILDGIDEAAEVFQEEGGTAVQDWAAARKLSSGIRQKKNSAATRKRPEILAKLMDNDIASDEVINELHKAKVDELESFMSYMLDSEVAKMAGAQKQVGKARRALYNDFIKFSSGNSPEAPLSGAKMKTWIDKFGPEKMKVMWPNEAAEIIQLVEAVGLETIPPPGNRINYSNTGNALINLLHGVGRLPGARIATEGAAMGLERIDANVAGRAAGRNVLSPPVSQVSPNVLHPGAAASGGAAAGLNQQQQNKKYRTGGGY